MAKLWRIVLCLVLIYFSSTFIVAADDNIDESNDDPDDERVANHLTSLLERLRKGIASLKTTEEKRGPPGDDDANRKLAQEFIVHGSEEHHPKKYDPSSWPVENEDDMRLTHDDKVLLNLESEYDNETPVPVQTRMAKRKFMHPKGDSKLWAHGIIPYKFNTVDRVFQQPDTQSKILSAMQWYMDRTCIQFKVKSAQTEVDTGHTSYGDIGTANGCWSYVGRATSGAVKLGLSENGCTHQGTILHELGHLMGMLHEHTRSDRDGFVTIDWSRVPDSVKNNFVKSNTFNYAPYDLGSMMHYGYSGFSPNGHWNILPNDPEIAFLQLPRPNIMSFYDLEAINFAYGCADHCDPVPSCEHGAYVDKTCQCVCPDGLMGSLCEGVQTDASCGGIFDVSVGATINISTPGYPGHYSTGISCRWLFRAPQGQFIKFDIDSFDIPPQNGQCDHYMETRYNLIAQPGPEYCGSVWGRGTFETSVEQPGLLLIQFKSTGSGATGTGFSGRVFTKDIGCRIMACQNGATCDDSGQNATCICAPGFSGPYCEIVGSGLVSCTFEAYDCSFSNVLGLPLSWTYNEGSTMSGSTGPSSGYQSQTYMYIEASNTEIGQHGRIMSPVIQYGPRCLTFYVHMYGASMGQLDVILLSGGTESNLMTISGDQGGQWNKKEIQITSSSSFRVIFQGTVGDSYKSDIAIDNVVLAAVDCSSPLTSPPTGMTAPPTSPQTGITSPPTSPPTITTHSSPQTVFPTAPSISSTQPTISSTDIACSFDNFAACPFNVDITTNIQWAVITGNTPSAGTGPLSGYGGSGSYMYMEASGFTTGDTARLVSSEIDGTIERCLTFYYNMLGNSQGSLNVMTIASTAMPGQESIIWSTKHDHGYMWRPAAITIPTNTSYHIIFEGIRGRGWRSDTAIDEVQIMQGSCSSLGCRVDICKNGATCDDSNTPVTCICQSGYSGTYCDEIDSAVVFCDFEGTTECLLENEVTDSPLFWSPHKGSTSSRDTGPTGGYQSAGYSYMEASRGGLGKTARYVSPIFTDSPRCVTFYLHMYGELMGDFDLIVLSNGQETSIMTLSGNHSDHWMEMTKTVTAPGKFQIIFQGTRGRNYESDIALDDVLISPGYCATTASPSSSVISTVSQMVTSPTMPSSSSPSQSSVGTSPVSPATPVPIVSSTSVPGPITISCPFDDLTLCIFQQDVADDFDWLIHNGESASINTGPMADHTGSGHYLLVEASEPRVPGDSAVLVSSDLHFPGCNSMCLSFWYHINGGTPGLLVVRKLWMASYGAIPYDSTIWRSEQTSDQWQPAHISISQSGVFKLILEGMVAGWQGDIAVDDLSITQGPCDRNISPS